MIYITTFNSESPTHEITGRSEDSGFATLDDVMAIMGEPPISKSPRLLIYYNTCFSNYPFTVQPKKIKPRLALTERY